MRRIIKKVIESINIIMKNFEYSYIKTSDKIISAGNKHL